MYTQFWCRSFVFLGIILLCMSSVPARDVKKGFNINGASVKKEDSTSNIGVDNAIRLQKLAMQHEESGLIEAALICRALVILAAEPVNIKQREEIISTLAVIYMAFLANSTEMDKDERNRIAFFNDTIGVQSSFDQLKAHIEIGLPPRNLNQIKNSETKNVGNGLFESLGAAIKTLKGFASKSVGEKNEVNNLPAPQATAPAASLIEIKHEREKAYYAVLAEFGGYYIELLNGEIKKHKSTGSHEYAKDLSNTVDGLVLMKLRSEKGSVKGKEAALQFATLESRKEAAERAKRGDQVNAKKFNEFADLLQQEAGEPMFIGLTGSVATPGSQKQMALAVKQAELGNLVQAEKNLAEACPTFHQRSFIDVSAKSISEISGRNSKVSEVSGRNSKVSFDKEDNTFSECFAELTLIRAQGSFGTNVDHLAFISAQNATITEAGAALAHSTARKYIQTHGGGAALEQVDVKVNTLFKNTFNAFDAIKTDNLEIKDVEESLVQLNLDMIKGHIELDKIIRSLVARFPEYFNLRAPKPIPISLLQASDSKLLKNDEAIILWMNVPGNKYGLVIAVSKTRTGWAKMTATGRQISTLVAKLRQQVDPCASKQTTENCSFASLNFDLNASWELYHALLGAETIQNVISDKKIKTLLIVPSGPLTTLPPALLITAQPKSGQAYNNSPEGWANAPWLIKEKAIAILPSIAALQTLREVIPKTKQTSAKVAGAERLFMVADPDFSGQGKSTGDCMFGSRAAPKAIQHYFADEAGKRAALAKLTRLPCTRLEGEVLKQALGGSLLLGQDARESQLRTQSNQKKLAQAEVVVFATHGLVSGDLGLGEPALAMAAPLNTENGDDGLLTASEVTELKLSAEWVVLSACNTASPALHEANGLWGLSNAFFYAGAKSVLASHWRVHDATTKDLMTKAIGRKENVSKAQALRDASLALLERDDNKYAHPAFWAPFTLIGEPR